MPDTDFTPAIVEFHEKRAMNGMDEWQAIQNERMRLMKIVEDGVAEKNAEIERLRAALEEIGNGGNAVYPQWGTTGPKTREEMAAIARVALGLVTNG